LKCGASNRQFYTLFQDHAELCDPYYAERLHAIPAMGLPPEHPSPPIALYEDNDDYSNTFPTQPQSLGDYLQSFPPPPPPPPGNSDRFNMIPLSPAAAALEDYHSDDSYDERETLHQLTIVLPTPAQNLLNYYVPIISHQESTFKGCWTAESRLYKFDKSLVAACDIVPGDLLLGPNGTCCEVAAVIMTSLETDPGTSGGRVGSIVKIVQLSKYCSLTSGHPVLDQSRGIYVRSDSIKPSSKQMIEKLFNFELKAPCEGGGVICEGGVVAATVGRSFDEVRKYSNENDKIWGDDYWKTTRDLLQKNYFQNIKYISHSSVQDR